MRALSALVISACALAACTDPCASRTPGYVCAIAGTGDLGFNGDGRDAARTDFYLLSAVRRGPDGRVYMMDFNNQRLRYLDEEGRIATVAGDGDHALAAIGTLATASPLENPVDFDFLPDGRIVFVSYHDPRVLRIEADGTLAVVAGAEEMALRGDEGDGFGPLEARFNQLESLAIGPDGTLYLADSIADRVRMIRGGVVSTLVGDGQVGYSGDGGPSTAARVSFPTALALDATGALLIADTRNHVVRRVATDGTITTIAGNGMRAFAGDGGPAIAAALDQPNGLAVDTDGSLYIADRGNFRIRRVAPDGFITTIAGTGTQGHAGDGGLASAASFGFVARLTITDGTLYVADQSNACARRIVLR